MEVGIGPAVASAHASCGAVDRSMTEIGILQRKEEKEKKEKEIRCGLRRPFEGPRARRVPVAPESSKQRVTARVTGGVALPDERSGPPESGAPLEERRIRRVGDGAGRPGGVRGDRTRPTRALSDHA